jgi:ABC-2 type transport system permease protein
MNMLNIPATLSVAWKDIKILLNERGQLIYLFLIPLVFILAFSSAFAGSSDDTEEQLIPLPVVNLDPDSEASQTLIDALNQAGGVHVEVYSQEEAQVLLDAGEIRRVLTIPANYGTDLEAGRPVTLRLVSDPDASAETSEAAQSVVEGVAADMSLETQLIRSFQQMADMQAGEPSEEQVFTANVIVAQAQSQFERSRTEPLVGVEERWPEHLLSEEEDINPVDVMVPGFAIMFIFLTAQATAQSIYEEKKVGSFRRLLAAPISKGTILVGKMVPNLITALAQFVVIFAVGVLLLPQLGISAMTLGNDPLALILVTLVIALCSTSLGVLIAGLARTEGQISGLSTVVLWCMGFAGILLLQIPRVPAIDTIAQVIPHYWANEAFHDLLVRGQGLADVMSSILPLLGLTIVFFVLGLWRFEFD